MKPRAKKLTSDQIQSVEKFLRDRDFQLWFEKRRAKHVIEMIFTGTGVSMSATQLRKIVRRCELKGEFRWYRQQKRARPSSSVLLTEGEWDRLRAAVRKQADLLVGKTLDECVAIVSLVCRCNSSTLSGLEAASRVWEATPDVAAQ